MSDPRTLLVLHPEREVPAADDLGPGAPGLSVDALVTLARPGAAVLRLKTRDVNYKNNQVLVNGQPMGYLKGPGHGAPARGYHEAMTLPPGTLVPGVNQVRFTAGRDVSQGEAGEGRVDRYTVREVSLSVTPRPDPAGGLPVGLAGAGILVGVVAAWMAVRRG